jgi:hypothetical protein
MAAAFSVGLSLATLFTLLVVPAGYYTLAQLLARRGIGVGSGDVHASEKAAAGVTQVG